MKFRDWRYELREKGWHKHFAWIPVKVGYNGEWAWLQFVERRLTGWGGIGRGYHETWSYRLKEGAPEVGFQ
jgi:hypothetical protein